MSSSAAPLLAAAAGESDADKLRKRDREIKRGKEYIEREWGGGRALN